MAILDDQDTARIVDAIRHAELEVLQLGAADRSWVESVAGLREDSRRALVRMRFRDINGSLLQQVRSLLQSVPSATGLCAVGGDFINNI